MIRRLLRFLARGIAEIPLRNLVGADIGKLRVNREGLVKIEMSEWMRPRELIVALAFLTILSNQEFSRPNNDPGS